MSKEQPSIEEINKLNKFIENFDKLDNLNIWSEPYDYKGIKLYPVKMKDCMKFYSCVCCLLYEKNKEQNIELLKMSYMQYLYTIIYYNKEISFLLLNLFKLVLHDQEFKFQVDNNNQLCFCINNNNYYANDFDEIKKIICKQNLIKLNEEILPEDIEEALREAQEWLSQKNKPATIEERIVAYRCAFYENYNEIKGHTIYQFNKDLERENLLKSWEVYTYPALKGGDEKAIPNHWLSHIPERGLYDDVTMNMDEFNSMTSDSGIFAK